MNRGRFTQQPTGQDSSSCHLPEGANWGHVPRPEEGGQATLPRPSRPQPALQETYQGISQARRGTVTIPRGNPRRQTRTSWWGSLTHHPGCPCAVTLQSMQGCARGERPAPAPTLWALNGRARTFWIWNVSGYGLSQGQWAGSSLSPAFLTSLQHLHTPWHQPLQNSFPTLMYIWIHYRHCTAENLN